MAVYAGPVDRTVAWCVETWSAAPAAPREVHADRAQPARKPDAAARVAAFDQDINTAPARPDFSALRKRIGKPAANHRARLLLTLG